MFVEGAGLARGYLRRPELTAERFPLVTLADGRTVRLYRSGDQARLLPSGDLEYLGRIDHQVKIRGFRIELGEIESVIAQHAAVREVVVMAREDTPGDKRLVAYLTAAATDGLLEELRARIRARLPDYMVPAAFVILPRLPLTENGKVDRRALPLPDAVRPALETEFVEPEGETETAIAAIWRRLLRVDRVGANDSFFDLGGSSVLAVESLSALRRELGRAVPVVALFRHPTVRGLAAELSGGGAGALAPGRCDDARRAAAERPARTTSRSSAWRAGFPGARSVDELWVNLCAGREGVRFFADDELDPRVDSAAPGYVKARGVLADADKFDAPFFGEPPAVAELIDPQQRVFLEIAWAALEDAGVVPGKHGATIGVFAGTGHNTYLLRERRAPHRSNRRAGRARDDDRQRQGLRRHAGGAQAEPGRAGAQRPHRLLDVAGGGRPWPRGSLLDYECDIALAGGASVTVPAARRARVPGGGDAQRRRAHPHLRRRRDGARSSATARGWSCSSGSATRAATATGSTPSSAARRSTTTAAPRPATRRPAWQGRRRSSRWRTRWPVSIRRPSPTSRRTAPRRRSATRSRSRR